MTNWQPGPRLSIVHILPELGVGGPSNVVYALAGAQAVRHGVRLLAFRGGSGEERARDLGLACDVLYPQWPPGMPCGIGFVMRALRAARTIRAIRPDLAHVHLVGYSLEAAIATGLARVPSVGHLHTVFTPEGLTGINRNVLRYLRPLYRHGNLICLTEAARQVFGAHGIAAHVVHNAVDLAAFDRRLRDLPRALPDNSTPKVVLLARLSPEKCPGMFVRAAAQVLCGSTPGAEFYIAGEDGPLTGEVRKQIAELGVGGHVHMLGHRNDVPAVLRDCHVVCLTSREEGFPVVLIEAGAAAKPCVVTDTTGVREVVEDGRTGFVVPVGDHGALADRVVRLLTDPPLRQRLGQQARRRVEERFNPAVQAERTMEVYRQVLRRRAGFDKTVERNGRSE